MVLRLIRYAGIPRCAVAHTSTCLSGLQASCLHMCSGPQRIDHVWCSCVYVLCVYLCVSLCVCSCVCICVCVCVCMCVWVCVFPGKLLNDAIMADAIDYDAFLTGGRNEATYTMFKGPLSLSLSVCACQTNADLCIMHMSTPACVCMCVFINACAYKLLVSLDIWCRYMCVSSECYWW